MITETGENLHVLVVCSPTEDWRTFSVWYSISKNLPDAKVVIACLRNKKVEYQYFQWTKRLNLPIFYSPPVYEDRYLDRLHVLGQALQRSPANDYLVVTPNVMVVDCFNSPWMDLVNEKGPRLELDYDVWFVKDMDKKKVDQLIDEKVLSGSDWESGMVLLGPEAKETQTLSPVVTYGKGCGKFIDSMYGCPFSSVASLMSEEITVNERRILELWRKMASLYSVVL